MILIPIKTRLINPKEDILNIIIDSMNENNVSFKENDILVLAESAVATSQGRLVKLSQITPSKEALNLGKKFQMDSRLTELILKEADMIIGGVPHVLLTLKDGVFQANAGIDKSNAPEGYVTLLPENPSKTAQEY
ncbi:MAG: coenzyme F420-0:L-glutamate ligase, partial [Candidatus Odinarchaeia archaeon]